MAYIVVVKDAWADGEGSMGTASKKIWKLDRRK